MNKLKWFVFFVFIVVNNYGQVPNDCVNSIVICGNSNLDLDVSGIGFQELNNNNNCSSVENNTVWLKLTVATSGTLGFTLTPNSTDISEDYDFFIFGPDVTCDNLGFSIRCSTTNPAMANQGNNLTGMKDLADDETSEGPGPNGDSFVEWLNVQADETYYLVIDRPVGNSPFSLEWIGTATFYDAPSNMLPNGQELAYSSCDITGNGTGLFDLTQDETELVGNQIVAVDYYRTLSNAQIGINEIQNPNSYYAQTGTYFVKLTDVVTKCFSIFDINITVEPFMALPTLDNLHLCDVNNDNQEVFDLTLNNNLLSQVAINYTISYHLSENEAIQNINPISMPSLFINSSNPQTIWLRLNDLDTGCYGKTSFDIQVYAIPEANQVANIFICDDDNDGFSIFDLNSVKTEVLNGQNPADFNITFHHSQVDAIANINPLSLDYTNETAFVSEQIYYRIENNEETSCFDTNSFNVQVFESPIANPIEDWIVCDADNDGFNEFDLDTLKELIYNVQDENTFNIDFYHSQNDADLRLNPLPNLYTNADAYTLEEIFVRIENISLNSCNDVTSFNIKVNYTPLVNTISNWIICDDDNGGFYTFDFTLLYNDLLNGQDQSLVDISFYESQIDADLKILPLGLNYTNTLPFEQKEIFVRMENKDNNECFTTNSFFIEVVESPNFNIVEDTKYLCVNQSNQSVTFEISDLSANYTLSWKDENDNELSTSTSLEVSEIGDYAITATSQDGNFCETEKTVHVLPAEPAMILDFTMNEYWQEDNFSIDIAVQGSGIYQYAIDDINGSYQDSSMLVNIQPGFHTIYVKEVHDCGITSKEIATIGFRKFFTPNNDGAYDDWKVQGIFFRNEDKVTVFNRYGKVMSVFYPALNQGWNGYYNGIIAPEDDYWFTAEMTNINGEKFIRKGHFSLVLTK